MATWDRLASTQELQKALKNTELRPAIFLKHSTRCAISTMAKNRLEKTIDTRISYHIIDVLQNRKVSDALANKFEVTHQSPQAFLVFNGVLREVKSHLAIQQSVFSDLVDTLD